MKSKQLLVHLPALREIHHIYLLLIGYFGMTCICVIVTSDNDACPFTHTLPVPPSFGGMPYVKHHALRLHVIISNNLKHFKKHKTMHSHHFKPYDKETSGKRKARVRLCRNTKIPRIMPFSAPQKYI